MSYKINAKFSNTYINIFCGVWRCTIMATEKIYINIYKNNKIKNTECNEIILYSKS